MNNYKTYMNTSLCLFEDSNFKIKEINDNIIKYGRKELDIALNEMPGLNALRKEYRDILKQYSKRHGLKMYALLEDLIKKNCTKIILYSNQS